MENPLVPSLWHCITAANDYLLFEFDLIHKSRDTGIMRTNVVLAGNGDFGFFASRTAKVLFPKSGMPQQTIRRLHVKITLQLRRKILLGPSGVTNGSLTRRGSLGTSW